MIFTLHRYIFRELLRVFVLATIALTLMLSLGSMLRPIQDFGVGPEQLIHLLGYFLPITLTFVLPMSALFATALIYGRFASDNELNACRASGIGLMTLVYPGLCLAIVITITTLILSFHVVPAFVHRAERAIKANAKQILFRNIQRRGSYTLPGRRFRIYADHASPENDMLMGVVIVELKGSDITKLMVAETAKVLIDDQKTFNKVTVVAQQYYQIDDYGNQVYSGQLPISGRFASLLSDNIKFQKIEQIKEIKLDMMNFYPVRQLALSTRAQLSTELLAEAINKKIVDEDNCYYELSNEDVTVMFTAAECVPGDEWTVKLVGPVRLLELDKVFGKLYYQYDSSEGFLKLKDEQVGSKMELVLKNAAWERTDGIKSIAPQPQRVFRNLVLSENVIAKIDDSNLLYTLDNVPTILAGSSPFLSRQLTGLQRKIKRTRNEISAETHSRLVFGLGCITIVLISIALGIIFRGGHLLSAFGASSIPAAVLIVFVMSGRDLIKNPLMPPSAGIIVMWVGLIVLSALTVLMYRKLLKT